VQDVSRWATLIVLHGGGGVASLARGPAAKLEINVTRRLKKLAPRPMAGWVF